MAEEDEIIVAKSTGGKGGLIPIISLALIVVTLGLSAISLVTVMGLKNGMAAAEGDAASEEMMTGEISVTDIDTFAFTDNFIFRYQGIDNPKVTNTVVVDVSIGILTTEDTEEDATILKALLASKESIVRDGLETLLTTRKFAEFQTKEGQELIKSEILLYLQEKLVTELIIDVYFNNLITQSS